MSRKGRRSPFSEKLTVWFKEQFLTSESSALLLLLHWEIWAFLPRSFLSPSDNSFDQELELVLEARLWLKLFISCLRPRFGRVPEQAGTRWLLWGMYCVFCVSCLYLVRVSANIVILRGLEIIHGDTATIMRRVLCCMRQLSVVSCQRHHDYYCVVCVRRGGM